MTRLRRDRPRRLPMVVFTAALVAFQAVGLVGAQTAAAAVFTGGFSPKIFSGAADLNGDGVVNGRDDSNDFFGDTDIIDGKLDCNAWGATENAGSAGDGSITDLDDCTLVAFDGTSDGVTITVTDGAFGWPTGTALPTVYNADNPDSPGVFQADFAWSTILGKVDSSGDELITGDDCTLGLIGQTVDTGLGDPTDGADVLGTTCGIAPAPDPADNGKVDLNSDATITSADTCTNGCFFGHNVTLGLVQIEGATSAPTISSFSPTSGPVGSTVTINGTNFTGATSVKFNGVSATFIVNSATKITATVPTGATTGPISVTTAGGTATSTSNFRVTGPEHARSISLSLRGHLRARGAVTVEDDFSDCAASVPVKIQRKKRGGGWKTVKLTTTSATGSYAKKVRDKPGTYRAVARKVTLESGDVCLKDVSNMVRHRH